MTSLLLSHRKELDTLIPQGTGGSTATGIVVLTQPGSTAAVLWAGRLLPPLTVSSSR